MGCFDELRQSDTTSHIIVRHGAVLCKHGRCSVLECGTKYAKAESELETFSLAVEKLLCRFFEWKNLCVWNAFLHTKLADERETWHLKKRFFNTGAECL